ncbi:MAG: DUF1015 domain-containing protein [Clostridiales bacterium]|nr:DUF1015 domain-containing protein [Clostridiales bacterium]MDD7034749.1 DUF1015 domain-containing protein [Bacillota bacterium]MDY2919795.1 DUF1015 domain-containing protein [Lentihominibacter sp.]
MSKTGFSAADILLPAEGNYETWAVVACDQFTSQPEYWEKVEETVGDKPSTFRIILPEAQLTDGHTEEHIDKINSTMRQYLDNGVFKEYPDAMIYLERVQSDGKIRRGLIGKIDLEKYDYSVGSTSLVRATEGTVLDRIPPRQAVRRDAAVELPHVMLLIDDVENSVIGPMSACSDVIYDFDLMAGGGHAKGWLVPEELKKQAMGALEALADKQPLLFAVGDGNHSLASAKALYEEEKAKFGPGSEKTLLSRYALVEVVNLYDSALEFEPIHRVLFDIDPKALMDALKKYYPDTVEGKEEGHVIEYAYEGARGFITVKNPKAQLEVGTLQAFLDEYIKETGARIDYVHGDDITVELGSKPGCIAFLLPAMDKGDLFKSVINDGALPRKTFSMGHAEDKRYYIEARKIK